MAWLLKVLRRQLGGMGSHAKLEGEFVSWLDDGRTLALAMHDSQSGER